MEKKEKCFRAKYIYIRKCIFLFSITTSSQREETNGPVLRTRQQQWEPSSSRPKNIENPCLMGEYLFVFMQLYPNMDLPLLYHDVLAKLRKRCPARRIPKIKTINQAVDSRKALEIRAWWKNNVFVCKIYIQKLIFLFSTTTSSENEEGKAALC